MTSQLGKKRRILHIERRPKAHFGSRGLCTSDDINNAILSFLGTREIGNLCIASKGWWSHVTKDGGLNSLVAQVDRGLPQELGFTTLRQIALYEYMKRKGIYDENRLGFRFGETVFNTDAGEYDEEGDDYFEIEVKNTQKRKDDMQKLMKLFPNVFAHTDAHCGTNTARGQVRDLTHARAELVVDVLAAGGREERVASTAWGNRIHRIVQEDHFADHPHHPFAKVCGLSWATGHFVCDGLVLPPYPRYYPRFHAQKVAAPFLEQNRVRPRVILAEMNFTTEDQRRLYEYLRVHNLYDENRLGFRFGEIKLSPDKGEYQEGDPFYEFEIESTQTRLRHIRQILRDFQEVQVHLDVFCGSTAPPSRVNHLCHSRRTLLVDQLVRDLPSRCMEQISSTSWGKHRRETNIPLGWASVSFTLDGMTFLAAEG